MKIKSFFILIIGLLFFIGILYYNFYFQKKSRAGDETVEVNMDRLKVKRIFSSASINRFALYGSQGSPVLSFGANSSLSNLGIKAFTGKRIGRNFLPRETVDQLALTTSSADQSGRHFYYQQSISNTPVYGAQVNFHVDGNSQVYGFVGEVVTGTEIPAAILSEAQAQEIALNEAGKDAGSAAGLYIYQSKQYILNKRLIGMDDDESNHLVLAVWIRSENNSSFIFSKEYFIDMISGSVIYEEEKIIEGVNREIRRCSGGVSNCSVVRSEGQGPVTDNDANVTYDILGQIHNFYFSAFNRDSYDGNGAKMVAGIHLSDSSCPNAFADPQTEIIFLCNGMNTADIVAHEMQHLVTGNRLIYQKQSGAMNESLSDIFATGTDTDDWEMGDGSVLGPIRFLDDPPRGKQPDKLSSDKYACGNLDNGGVHVNSGVLNKAFYLMSAGGSFNGCSVTAVGKDKAHKIVYRAMMTYITQSANFRDMYDAIGRACEDLYGAGSAECLNVSNSMKAVEMDQQPSGTQQGPKCTSTVVQAPSCSAVSGEPSVQPSGQPSAGPTGQPTPTIVSGGNVRLNLRLKFQGIGKKPEEALNTFPVKITLVSGQEQRKETTVNFVGDDAGIWSGTAEYQISDPSNDSYYVLVKGPKHIQKRICEVEPAESEEGRYRCDEAKIKLNFGDNRLDFSRIVLLAGDLPEQDGVVNSYDLSLIRQRLGFEATAADNPADINLDGVINTQDYSLVIYSLSTRFDE